MSVTEWVGSTPPSWPLVRIKHVCRTAGGGTPDKGRPEYWQGGIPWVSPKDMKSDRITVTEDHITTEGLSNSATQMVPPNSVLLVMRSGILRHSIPVAINQVPVSLNQDMRAFLCEQRLAPRFLARLIEGHQAELLQAWSKVGATVESLESDLIGDTLIPLPPRREQEAIVSFLDRETSRLDALVAVKQRVLDLLAEKRKAIIATAVRRGLDPKVRVRDSGVPWLGEIPAHWEIWKVGHVAKVGNGSTPERDKVAYWSEGSFPWLNSSVVNQEEVTSSDQFVTDAALRECHLPRLRPGTVLVAITGQGKTRGQAVVLSIDATINQHMAFVAPDPALVDAWFLRWSFYRAYDYMRSISDDAGGTKGALTCEDVAGLRIPVPPPDEQRAIVEHIAHETAKLDAVRAATERIIALLKERRPALFAAAVTGQFDVGYR